MPSERGPQQDQIDKLKTDTNTQEYSFLELVESLNPSRYNKRYDISYDFSSSGGSTFGSKDSESEEGLPKIADWKR